MVKIQRGERRGFGRMKEREKKKDISKSISQNLTIFADFVTPHKMILAVYKQIDLAL